MMAVNVQMPNSMSLITVNLKVSRGTRTQNEMRIRRIEEMMRAEAGFSRKERRADMNEEATAIIYRTANKSMNPQYKRKVHILISTADVMQTFTTSALTQNISMQISSVGLTLHRASWVCTCL